MKRGFAFNADTLCDGHADMRFQSSPHLASAGEEEGGRLLNRSLRRRMLLAVHTAFLLGALIFLTIAPLRAQSKDVSSTGRQPRQSYAARGSVGGGSLVKRLTALRSTLVAEGSRIAIASDMPLNDYSAYRSGERFYVLIPGATAAASLTDKLNGPGFTDVQVEQRGEDVMLSFGLQAGASASVSQKFNRLDVNFVVPGEAHIALASAADAQPTPTPSPTPSPSSGATDAANIANPPANADTTTTTTTTTTTAVEPAASAPSVSDAATTNANPSTSTQARQLPLGKAALVLPPEKANPVRVPRFEKPPVIDGRLDDEAWKGAVVLKDFYQIEPGDNLAPSRQTEVLIGYDPKNLYIAYRAYDEKQNVRATVAKRDAIFDDDYVGLFFDTFNDQRKAYEMNFNPLGIQADGILTSGVNEDFSVDMVVESKGTVVDDGYIVEVAIPFKSLRYEAGKDKLWGAHFYRRIKRFNNELDMWMPISRDVSNWLVQAGHLTGLEDLSTERTLEVIPSLTLSETGKTTRSIPRDVRLANRSLVDPGRFINEPIKFDPGVTVKYGITPTVTLDFALNPDFAQVEADQTVVTANQRFPIFFEEKRPFFLEGIDIFRTQILAVHTRSIVDPDVAAKLTGKIGRNSFGLLLASDNAPGNFSEEEIEDPDFTSDNLIDKNAYIGVLRLKRDIGKEHSLGFLATTYNFIQKHNHLGGFDGRFKLDKVTTFDFQVLASNSRFPFYDPDRNENIYRTGNGFIYAYSLNNEGRHFGYNYAGVGRTQDYRSDVGFNRRVNTNLHELFVRWNSEPNPKGRLTSWRAYNYFGTNFDFQGRMQRWNEEAQIRFNFPRQSFIAFAGQGGYERVFEEEFGPRRNAHQRGQFAGEDSERTAYRKNFYIYGGTTPSKKYSIFVLVARDWGILDFDFGAGNRFPRVSPGALLDPDAPQDPGAGNNWHIESNFVYQPTNELRLSLDYFKERLVRNDTGLVAFDDNIFALRGTYQFTRFTFARARVDYDTLASSVRGQFLLGWAPNPGTSFYVGYNDDLNLN
ncbi:MAG TPA: DUF5916 domain-containing protein, partial [Pyrinomonadaceae bacterium]|nr:DUF5916 domain-containing protein [Pyrinomonadaceae bacterium]